MLGGAPSPRRRISKRMQEQLGTRKPEGTPSPAKNIAKRTRVKEEEPKEKNVKKDAIRSPPRRTTQKANLSVEEYQKEAGKKVVSDSTEIEVVTKTLKTSKRTTRGPTYMLRVVA